jgi:hypothetical protein
MNAAAQEAEFLRTTNKLLDYLGRGILTPREVVNKLTEELAYHGLTDLASTVLQRLPALVAQELRGWISEVLEPEYQYRPFILGNWPSDEYRQEYIRRMQSELVTLAGRIDLLLT